jgi:hypothetical protein
VDAFLFNGVEILLAEDYAWLSNNRTLLVGSSFHGSFGMVIGGTGYPKRAMRIPSTNRYLAKTPRAGHMEARRKLNEMRRRMEAMGKEMAAARARFVPDQAAEAGP